MLSNLTYKLILLQLMSSIIICYGYVCFLSLHNEQKSYYYNFSASANITKLSGFITDGDDKKS